jgi:hypothetical protein
MARRNKKSMILVIPFIPLNSSDSRTAPKNDGLVKSKKVLKIVIPAKAGIQLFQNVLDPGFRRGDEY